MSTPSAWDGAACWSWDTADTTPAVVTAGRPWMITRNSWSGDVVASVSSDAGTNGAGELSSAAAPAGSPISAPATTSAASAPRLLHLSDLTDHSASTRDPFTKGDGRENLQRVWMKG